MIATGVIGVKAAELNLDTNDDTTLDKMEVTTDIPIEETTVNQSFDAGEEINNFEDVSYSKGVMIDDKDYRLYPEFENVDQALKELRETVKTAMDYLKTNYSLEELSDNNYREYQHCVCDALESEQVQADESLEKELNSINDFLDIYENKDANNEILETVNSVDGNFEGTTVSEAAQVIGELQQTLPYNTGADDAVDAVTDEIADDVGKECDISFIKAKEVLQKDLSDCNQTDGVYQLNTTPISEAGQQMELLSYTGNKVFNVSKGVAYAKKYATNRNKAYYKGTANRDCTNFVSQIKKAGGVKEYTDWSAGVNPFLRKSFSWYYENKNDYGAIWVNANKFVKFFGVKYRTKNFYTFSTKVKKGSFISYDEEGDGDWNHMAFVTATTNTKKKTHGITYHNFQVAQHTRDYLAYVSAEKNGWEELVNKHPKVVFAIVN